MPWYPFLFLNGFLALPDENLANTDLEATMADESTFLLITESGAGGYMTATSPSDARHRASFADGHGWIFRCEFDDQMSERHRRAWPLVMLRLIATLGRPDEDAMADALDVAGERHRAVYQFAVNDYE